MRYFIRVMVGVSIFAGCAEPGDPLNTTPAVTAIGEPTGAAVTAMIGPAGGTLRSADGALELIVPAGALAAETALSVTPLSVTSPGGVKSFRLGPEGTTFGTPATLKMTMTELEAGGAPQEGWSIAFQDSDRTWRAIPDSTIENTTIAVQTTHLSDWSCVLGAGLFPNRPLVQPGETIRLTPRFCGFDRKDPMRRLYECQDKGIDRFFQNWSVNGIPGGNAEFGTVQGNATGRTYTAPQVAPSPYPRNHVAVSVDWVTPEPGYENQRWVLVSNVTVRGLPPTTYAGTISLHLKQGGPGTSTLPSEYRVTAPVHFERGSSGNYDLKAGAATLESFTKENGITNCTCSVSNVQGTVQANTGALVLRDGGVTNLQLTAIFSVNLVCTGSTDPACSNTADAVVASWILTSPNPACMNMVDATYTEITHLNGTWSTICPVNPQLLGRDEQATWSLTGSE